ncbi:MAG: ABC transporter permease [Chromatocurvus sp.]
MLGIDLRLALRAIIRNKLQCILTLSGMSVAVAMVVIVTGLGRGAQIRIENQIESAGPTLITVKSGNYRPAAIANAGLQDSAGGEPSEGIMGLAEGRYSGPDDPALVAERDRQRKRREKPPRNKYRTPADPLSLEELELLAGTIENVRTAAATTSGNLSVSAGQKLPVSTVRLIGYQVAWPAIRRWQLVDGRHISAAEHDSDAEVALISVAAAQRLWPDGSALGSTLVLSERSLRIVGIFRAGDEDGGSLVVPALYVPLGLAGSLLGRNDFDTIVVRSRSVAFTSQVADDIRAALRELHALKDDTLDDFRVETQGVSAMPGQGMDPRLTRAMQSNVVEFEQASWAEMAKSLRQAGLTFTLLLSAAGSVSLIVGGIGIMNIMLVSVVARTREIGLRMAVGAHMNDVLRQFLVEAIVLATAGGLIGLLLGAGGLWIASRGFQWATAISPVMLLAAVVMAIFTGVCFGYGPARRAARLDPVVALKSE